MNAFENFKRTIGLIRQLDESDWLDEHARSIGTWDSELDHKASNQARSQLLEAHTRLELIDRLFESLGWTLTSRPGQVPTAAIEVPVTPMANRRWMDYLGFESDGTIQRPRLMIEAKRYRLKLPVEDRHSPPERHPFCQSIYDFACDRSLKDTSVEWIGYLDDHLDYLRGLEKQSGRLAVSAITNGVWLVIINDPHHLLVASSATNAKILCFESLEAVVRHATTVYQLLSRHDLCPGADLVRVKDVADVLDASNVAGLTFATVVTYDENSGPYKQSPFVKVAPLVALVGKNGSVTFCRADNDDDYSAPISGAVFATLLSEQLRLERRLQTRFRLNWPRLSVADLITRNVSVKTGIKRSGPLKKEWRFLTGTQPWIFSESMAVSCCAHTHQPTEDWHDTTLDWQPSVDPRTMFPAGHVAQCRHTDVKDIRHRKPIATGGGTGLTQPSLCWLYDLEQFGCCQNCIFLTHCPATRDIALPCDAHGLAVGRSLC